MPEDVKLRLYISIVVAVIVPLYIGPSLVLSHAESVRIELMFNCYKESPGLWGSCWNQSKAALPIWKFLLPYLPVTLLVWVNWLLKPNLRLSAQSFPKRTIKCLMWLGLVGALPAVGLSLWGVATQKIADIEARAVLAPPWLFDAVLVAPLLFNYLVGPVPSAINIRKEKIAVLALVVVPVVAFAIFAVRAFLTDSGQ